MESWFRIVQLKNGLCLHSSRDHDFALSEGIACLTSANDITDIQLQRDTPALLACVCVEKQEGWESWEQFRLACTTDCMPMPHLEKFPSNSCHVVLCEQRLKDSSSLDLNSTRTVNDAPLLIKLMKYVKWQALFAGSELSRGSGKSTGEASCPSNHRGPVKRDPTWMNEHGPADRGRSQCRKSAEDYCSPQSRDGTEATEANMTPVICTWFLFYNCKLLKVRMQLVNISRNGEKKHTRVLHVPQRKILFLLTAIRM